MKKLSQLGVDVFLSGHLHLHHIGDTTLRYKIKDYNGLIIQAGTAISLRSRGEPVSFNMLEIDRHNIKIDHYVGNMGTPEFSLHATEQFIYTERGWLKPSVESYDA